MASWRLTLLPTLCRLTAAARCVTPDGKWFMYKDPAEPSQSPDSPGEIMRVAINGGTAQEVMAVKKKVSWAGCSRSPSKLCAIAERTEDRKQAINIAFDPLNGRTAIAHSLDGDLEQPAQLTFFLTAMTSCAV